MNTKAPHVISTFLLLLGCSFASSCSTEPTTQPGKVIVEQSVEGPKPLEDVVVASEDEVPTWDDSADRTNFPSGKPNSNK